MKIVFTPEAWQLIRLISNEKLPVNGFVLGSEMGNYKIISTFIPFQLNEKNINRVYGDFFAMFATKFMGIFFSNSEIFLNDWLIDDLVIKIDRKRIEIFSYNGLETELLKEIIINGGIEAKNE